MLHELFTTHCTNGTSIVNPFTFDKDRQTDYMEHEAHMYTAPNNYGAVSVGRNIEVRLVIGGHLYVDSNSIIQQRAHIIHSRHRHM